MSPQSGSPSHTQDLWIHSWLILQWNSLSSQLWECSSVLQFNSSVWSWQSYPPSHNHCNGMHCVTFIKHWKWSASQDGAATKQKNKTFKNFQFTQNKRIKTYKLRYPGFWEALATAQTLSHVSQKIKKCNTVSKTTRQDHSRRIKQVLAMSFIIENIF